MVTNNKISSSVKICTLCNLRTLIWSNSLHLTIGSSLILIQNELWVPKCCHAHFMVHFFMFKASKNAIKIFVYHTYYTCYTSFFWVKSGSPIMWFHPWVKIYVWIPRHCFEGKKPCVNILTIFWGEHYDSSEFQKRCLRKPYFQ